VRAKPDESIIRVLHGARNAVSRLFLRSEEIREVIPELLQNPFKLVSPTRIEETMGVNSGSVIWRKPI